MIDTTLTFYKSASDYRALNKVLGTALGTAAGQLHEKINDVEMVIMLPGEYLNYCQNANIIYNSTTQKYYFLESYDVENNMVYVHLREDVRYNFRSQILTMNCTILRTESNANAYLLDNGYQIMAYDNIVAKTFPAGLTDESIILLTVG